MENSKIGVIICNYNKRSFLKKCVESILSQTYQNMDVCIVDNASSDDSVQMLRESFGNQVTVLCNEENVGGAGGFDCGLEYYMKKNCSYVLLVDNDTRYDKHALETMYNYMEMNADVGMCGASILQMGNPDFIQEIGGMIDYNQYEIVPNYRNNRISSEIPKEIDCDFLAACSLLIRREVIEKVGVMRRDYFVYWDDIEWSRRCKDMGYRLVALRDAHVWHNWSADTITKFNAFTEYYGRRNKLRFFATYIEEKDIDLFIDSALRNMFNIIYGHYRKGALQEMKASIYALDDMIHGVWGKAPAIKTSVETLAEIPLEKLLKSKKEVRLLFNDQMGNDGGISAIERVVRFCNPKIEIVVQDNNMQSPETESDDVLYIKPCPHVMRVTENILPIVQVDRFLNCIASEEDYDYFQNYENAYGLFYRLYEPLMREGVKKIRESSK